MDPLSALSLAACVVQFVDFGSKVIQASRELVVSSSSLDHLKNLTSDLVSLNDHLTQQLKCPSVKDAHLSREKQVSVSFSYHAGLLLNLVTPRRFSTWSPNATTPPRN